MDECTCTYRMMTLTFPAQKCDACKRAEEEREEEEEGKGKSDE